MGDLHRPAVDRLFLARDPRVPRCCPAGAVEERAAEESCTAHDSSVADDELRDAALAELTAPCGTDRRIVRVGHLDPGLRGHEVPSPTAAAVLVVADQNRVVGFPVDERGHAVEPARGRKWEAGGRIDVAHRIAPARDDSVLESLRKPEIAHVDEGAVAGGRNRLSGREPRPIRLQRSCDGETTCNRGTANQERAPVQGTHRCLPSPRALVFWLDMPRSHQLMCLVKSCRLERVLQCFS